MGADLAAAGMVHLRLHRLAGLRLAMRHGAEMHEEAQLLLRVAHHDARAIGGGDQPGVADLAAALGIEGGLVQDHRDLGAGRGGIHHLAVRDHGQDLGLGALGGVAEELAGADLLLQVEPERLGGGLARAGPGGAGTALLLGHGGLEALDIHRAALGAQRVLCQVEREAEGVVEAEGDLARQGLALAQPARLLGQQAQAAVQQGAETRLLQPEGLLDQRLRAHQLRIGGAHLAHQHRHQLRQQRLARAHHLGMAHGAAEDAAEHVAAPLVGGQHAVGDQEGAGAQVVRHHAVAGLEGSVRRLPHQLGAGGDQGAEGVRVVVVVHALQDRGEALQPHARVDRGAGQRRAHARRPFLVLHEDEVPDLDEAVAILVR